VSHRLRRDWTAADRVQHVAVVRLSHYGIDRADFLHSRLIEEVCCHGIGRLPDAKRAGQEDRRLQLTELGQLGDTDQLSEAIPHVKCRWHAIEEEIAGMRQDGGDPGTN
jgi:hypothetical protein